MPDTRIATDMAGRTCAIPAEAGSSVDDGEDIAFVEAMKMGIPATSPTTGKITAILVEIDEVIVEGQAVAGPRDIGPHDERSDFVRDNLSSDAMAIRNVETLCDVAIANSR